MIPALEIDEKGNVYTLYTDEIDLYAIGEVCNVVKASNVEFNQARQEWEVTKVGSSLVLYSNKNRDAAINWEIENFGIQGKYYCGQGEL